MSGEARTGVSRNEPARDRAAENQRLYEQARRHGYSHEKALECIVDGEVLCWCGSPTPCIGGAQQYVGCMVSYTPEQGFVYSSAWWAA